MMFSPVYVFKNNIGVLSQRENLTVGIGNFVNPSKCCVLSIYARSDFIKRWTESPEFNLQNLRTKQRILDTFK